VNAFLAHPEFRLETLKKSLPDVVQRGMMLFTTDLKSAYYSVLMEKKAAQYLAFAVDSVIYVASVMLFGLSTAPMVFHKIMRQIVRFLRVLKIMVLNYLDDFLWAETAKKVHTLIAFVRWLIPSLGFMFNEKCEWQPKQLVGFLGLLVDSHRFEVKVPTEKIQRVKVLLALMRARTEADQVVSLQDLRMLTGRIISFSLAMPAVHVWTREMYRAIAATSGSVALLTNEAKEELSFWLENIERLNGAPIVSRQHELIARTDASELGWGFEVNEFQAAGFLPEESIAKSSTHRELRGLQLGLKALSEKLSGRRVLVQLDSFAAARNLIKGGGPVGKLSEIVKEIWTLCDELKIQATYMWIPREENKRADELSKIATAEVTLRDDAKMALAKELVKSWQNEPTVWCNPMWSRISEAIDLARMRKQSIWLVHPIWQSQTWWPKLQQCASTSITFSRDCLIRTTAKNSQSITIPNWEFAVSYLPFGARLSSAVLSQ
jgi:ribonuclease HI